MSKMVKSTALFFSAVLFFLGTCTQNYGVLLTTNIQNTQSKDSHSYYSKEKPELVFLFRNDEKQINSGRNLPVPGLNFFSNNIRENSLIPELRLVSISSGYLSYSNIAERSLTNSDIIFPFHYFW